MSMRLIAHIGVWTLGFVASCCAAESSRDDLAARLRMARQLARERNDRDLVARVEKLARSDATDAEVREAEQAVGIDPGGWSMAGQPLFHATPAMAEASKPLAVKLAAAMQSDDPSKVRAVVAEMQRVLGDQAGVPDGRRAGKKPTAITLSEAEATKPFLNGLRSEERRVRQLSEGKPLPDQMVRLYGYLLSSVCEIRPFAVKHQPAEVARLDQLAQGLGRILLALQQPAGHFPFPDLRGKNIRFGDMINRQVNNDAVEVRDGWVVSPDPDGGSQFDTAVCGVALMRAGEVYHNQAWTAAGLHAADWARTQVCCGNFNYNAFSVWLLAEASVVSRQQSYLDAALKKFRVGVAPGQVANGRWIDAHNARSVYHVIILRGIAALAHAMPASMTAEVREVNEVALRGTKALIDEFDAMGITVDALPELLALEALHLEEPRLRKTIEAAASVLVAKGDRAGMNMALSALPCVWPNK